jgi:predicted nuclease of predicted toxin-antitoxin system
MRFLANENFPFPSITFLRQAGYNISSVAEQYPGISDYEVIEKAKAENSIILTFDKDYGEIIFKHGQENPPAVIFFRFKGENPETAGKLLIDLIKNKTFKLENKFTVIEKESVRQRSY